MKIRREILFGALALFFILCMPSLAKTYKINKLEDLIDYNEKYDRTISKGDTLEFAQGMGLGLKSSSGSTAAVFDENNGVIEGNGLVVMMDIDSVKSFVALNNGVINGVNIVLESGTKKADMLGVACLLNYGNINNCSVWCQSLSEIRITPVFGEKGFSMFGVVNALNMGSINNCSVKNIKIVFDYPGKQISNDIDVGLVCGSNLAVINACQVHDCEVVINTKNAKHLSVGGIAGYAFASDDSPINKAEISKCGVWNTKFKTDPKTENDFYVGAIAGQAVDNVTIKDCCSFMNPIADELVKTSRALTGNEFAAEGCSVFVGKN